MLAVMCSCPSFAILMVSLSSKCYQAIKIASNEIVIYREFIETKEDEENSILSKKIIEQVQLKVCPE